MKITSFKQLTAWQVAHQLVLTIYRVTEKFPKHELFGLTNQLRRASVSVTSNIAEGFGRRSNKEKTRFYDIALGSLIEVDNQITVARDLNYIDESTYQQIQAQIERSGKLINGLIRSIKK